MRASDATDASPEGAHSLALSRRPVPRLLDILLVLRKRSRMIGSVTLAAAALGLICSLLLPNVYTARTMILPAQEEKGPLSSLLTQVGGLAGAVGGGGGGGDALGGTTTADLYASLLKSDAVKDPIVDRFRLMTVYREDYKADASRELGQNSQITAGKKDRIITISVDDEDPRRAARIADAYVEELEKLVLRLNVTGAGQNRSFLEARLVKAKAELAAAEEKLKAFQSRNKAIQVTTQAEATIKEVAELRAKLAGQEVQLATYRRQLTESSQEVKNLVASVGNLKAQLAKLEGGRDQGAIPSVGSVPAIGQEYVRIMREFKSQEALVELLTKQYALAQLSEAKDVSPFQVILKAGVPERKSKPARTKITLAAAAAGFFCSLLLALGRDNFARLSEEERQCWMGVLKGRA
jgi:tyrosine-protein kinase Etk/Wzc